MKKEKYHYNLKTLQYEKIESSWSSKALKFLGYFAASLMTGIIFTVLFSKIYDSPKEKILKEEIAVLKDNYTYLEKEFDKVGSVLGSLRERDINTYRVIFEAEPISDDVWQAGTGGVNKYRELEKYNNGELMKRVHQKLDKMNKQLYLQSKSYDEINELIKQKEEMLASIPAIQPVSNKDLTRMASGYGMRIDPVYNVQKMHHGMDFTAETGTEIYATGDGVVIKADYSTGGYGNRIMIDHGYGYKTLYAHMSAFAVKKGEKVKTRTSNWLCWEHRKIGWTTFTL